MAFVESVDRGIAALETATDAEAWSAAASRLKGLAASFGAVRLMAFAEEAAVAGKPDSALLRRIRRLVDRF